MVYDATSAVVCVVSQVHELYEEQVAVVTAVMPRLAAVTAVHFIDCTDAVTAQVLKLFPAPIRDVQVDSLSDAAAIGGALLKLKVQHVVVKGGGLKANALSRMLQWCPDIRHWEQNGTVLLSGTSHRVENSADYEPFSFYLPPHLTKLVLSGCCFVDAAPAQSRTSSSSHKAPHAGNPRTAADFWAVYASLEILELNSCTGSMQAALSILKHATMLKKLRIADGSLVTDTLLTAIAKHLAGTLVELELVDSVGTVPVTIRILNEVLTKCKLLKVYKIGLKGVDMKLLEKLKESVKNSVELVLRDGKKTKRAVNG